MSVAMRFWGVRRRELPMVAVLAAAALGWLASTLGPSASVLHRPQSPAHRTGWGSVPLAARDPISAALGAEQPTYHVRRHAGGLVAASKAQRLHASFGRNGVSLRSGGSRLGLRLAGVGYGSSLAAVEEVAPHARANRVSYAHPGIDEWFANGPAGLEQGFTLARAPIGRAAGPLTLSLALSGNLRPALSDRDKALMLERRGQAVLAYRGLIANDARGHTLPSWLQLAGGRLLIQVDTRNAAYPVRIDPFIVQAELTASDGAAGDALGTSIAVSADGSTVVAGACGCGSGAGAAYVFTKPGGGWSNGTETAKLTASDGQPGDSLGDSVSISADGSTIVAGADSATVGVNSLQGAAYVFTESGGGWTSETETAKLTASDGQTNDGLGFSVAISGDGSTVLAGAPSCGCSGAGAAYVFAKPGGGWATGTQTAKLTASDGQDGDQLGTSVGISYDGSTIVSGAVGAGIGTNLGQGAAYVFAEPGGGWADGHEAAKLSASDGESNDQFGFSVAISADGSTVAGGTPFATVNGNSSQGAAYVFAKPGGGWATGTETAKLTASDGLGGDFLGFSVTFNANGSTLIAGAPFATVGVNSLQGAAYQFNRPAHGWATGTETAKLTASDGQPQDEFGGSVAISAIGSTVVAGLPGGASGNGQVDVLGPSHAAPVNSVAPVISGTTQDGQYLKVTFDGTWSAGDRLTYTYQWQRCDTGGANCTNVPAASPAYFYKQTSGDIGHKIQVIVTATDAENQTGQSTSNLLGPVTNPPAPQNTVAPVISGTTQDGQYLKVTSDGTWTSGDRLTYTYQWQRCDTGGANCTNVPAASPAYFYKQTSGDIGHKIQVIVTATDAENQTGQSTSNLLGPVTNPPAPQNTVAPVISGTTQDGQYLKVTSDGTWTSGDRLTYTYQWQRCDTGGANCANVPAASPPTSTSRPPATSATRSR